MGFKKELYVILIILILITNVLAVTVVETNPQQQPKQEGHWYSIFLSLWFWGILLFILILFGLGFGIFFAVRWFLRLLKKRTDIYYRLREEKTYLAKLQSRYGSTHRFRVSKNIPIRLVKINNGKPYFSEPIATHRGDYVSNEGNHYIALNLVGDKKFFFYPITSLLVIPNKDTVSILKKDKDGKTAIEVLKNIPKADNIIQFNTNEILLFAENLTQVGYFMFPVLRSQEGKIIDLSVPVYQMLKEVAMNEILYQQTSDFGILSKQASNLNPFLRTAQKLQDNNNTVDVPQGNN